MVLTMSWFVVWRYAGRVTIYDHRSEAEARRQFDELVDELGPMMELRLYQGDRRRSVGYGACDKCATLDDCCREERCRLLP